MEDTSGFDDYTPERLLTPQERKQSRQLLRSLSKLSAHWPSDASSSEKVKMKWRAHRDEHAAMSLAALNRACGLDLYMVTHIRRPGGYESKFQVLWVELMESYAGYQLGWHLEGSALRKDEMIGSRRGGIGFRFAKIVRRKLDGTWHSLSPHP
jgi:hypothetical protein